MLLNQFIILKQKNKNSELLYLYNKQKNNMKAEELMIGNWISWDNSWNNEPCKIVGIDPPLLKLVDRNNVSISSVRINSVKPIKITSQILIKNGFRQVFIDNSYYHKYEKENLCITCSQHKSDCKCRITIETKYERLCWVNIQYIHQLQNACSLVDKEFEINL